MTLPPRYAELVDRLWAALHEEPRQVEFALISKGPTCDIVDGLSDLDFRLVVDSYDPGAWELAADAFCRAFISFAHDSPDAWRLIEHPAGRCMVLDELQRPAVLDERYGWDVLREDSPGMISPLEEVDAEIRRIHLGKLLGYRDPYNPDLDPPVNVSPDHLPRYPLYSICRHYYAPALRCAAIAAGEGSVHGKDDALRWRRDAGSEAARRALDAVDSGFRSPVEDLAERCWEDIQVVASEVAGQEDPWPEAEKAQRDIYADHDERLYHLVSSNWMAISRWRFYIETPGGYDLEAVLRIDRGHIENYQVGPFDDEDWCGMLRQHAPDPDDHDQSMEFLAAQHRAAELEPPREVFASLCEHYGVVWKAMVAWYEELRDARLQNI